MVVGAYNSMEPVNPSPQESLNSRSTRTIKVLAQITNKEKPSVVPLGGGEGGIVFGIER